MFAPPPGTAAFPQSRLNGHQQVPPPYTFNQQQPYAPFSSSAAAAAQKPKLEPQYNEFGTICNLFNPYNADPKTMNPYENPKRPYANPSLLQQLHLQEMQRQYQQQQEMQRQHMLYLQQQAIYQQQQQQPTSYGRMPTYPL